MNRHNTPDARCVRLGFTQEQWADLHRLAAQNRRKLNAEIAHRIEESLLAEREHS